MIVACAQMLTSQGVVFSFLQSFGDN